MATKIVNLALFRAARDGYSVTQLLLNKEPKQGGKVMETLLTRHDQRWANHRDEPRHRTDGVCKPALWVDGKAASLENISKNGVMVATDLPNVPGSRVLVSIAGCRNISGLVIWKRDGLVGIELPVESMELLTQK